MATEYECDHCGSNAIHVGRAAMYALDGVEFPCEPVTVHSRPAWCDECQTLVDAEHLMDVDFYEQQLVACQSSELSKSDHQFIQLTNRTESEYRECLIDAWRIALSAASDRRSPPRCFTCGSTDITYILEYDFETHELARFPHPSCDGSFIQVGRTFINIDHLYLDGEGRQRRAKEQND